MKQRYPQKPRRKRRFRPLRRLLLILMAALLLYGTGRLAVLGYRKAFAPRVRTAIVQAVEQEIILASKALVLRDEVVIVAPREGTLNLLIDASQQVSVGTPLLELVDKETLAVIDAQLAEEEQKLAEQNAHTEEYIQEKANQLASAVGDFRSVTAAYGKLIRSGDPRSASTQYRELERLAQTVDKLHNEYLLISRSIDNYQMRYQELLEQRKRAIFTVAAPVSGVVSFTADGLSPQLRPSLASSVTLDTLRSIDSSTALVSGVTVAAGQPVCIIVDPENITLLTEINSGPRPELEAEFELLLGDVVLDAVFLQKTATQEENVYIYHYAVANVPGKILNQRMVDIKLRSLEEVLVMIPSDAIVVNNGLSEVYVVDSAGLVESYVVQVRSREGAKVRVTGLHEGQTVITTPRLVVPGQPLTQPGGG